MRGGRVRSEREGEERGEGGRESSTAVKVARYYEKHCYEDQNTDFK